MANANKAKGTSWETQVTGYLNECGLGAKRTGSADSGSSDIHAGDWTIEAKHEARIDLPGYLKQLDASVIRRQQITQRVSDFPDYKSAVWVKNRRHGTKDAYVVMSGQNYRALMVYIAALEGTLENITRNVLGGQDG